jgi:hypothetical protein
MVERPALYLRSCALEHRDRLSLPLCERRHEIFELHHEHRLQLGIDDTTISALSDSLQVADRLQTHFGIADFRSEPANVTQAIVLLSEESGADFLLHHAERGPGFLQMLSHVMNRRVGRLLLAARDRNRRFNLLLANSAKACAKCLSFSQSVAHCSIPGRASHCCSAFHR